MALVTILSPTQTRSKDSIASSPAVGLALRTNGEEIPYVLDAFGNAYPAGFTPPTVAPTLAAVTGGAFTDTFWVAYVYTYASSQFPYVETDNAINGQLYPSSNPSPLASLQFASPNLQVSGSVTGTTAKGVDTIWVFRTPQFATQAEAETAAAAGQAFFVVQLANPGTATTVAFTDNNPVSSTDQVSEDNYVAPQMQFCVYYDPYWWGFGNNTFVAPATWTNGNAGSTALLTLTAGDTWFAGRNGQNVTLPGVSTGGTNGKGVFLFLWLSSTTATLTIDGSTPTALPSTGSGNVTIQGPATTLYRSKARNPFSWGETEVIGTANVPQQYAFKVGGGIGTALAVIPNYAALKLDCEYPAVCYTLNLRAAGTAYFESTLRIISDVYSVSANFSQFAAVTMQGNTVLWGLDFKNFAIVQCDGNTQIPISTTIPKILRALTTNRTQQLLSHGVYDPYTELNCLWVATAVSGSLINFLIYQHAPTGFWGFSMENDILSSASIQDTLTGTVKTFVGTQTGILGQALVAGIYSNFLPDTGAYVGQILSATGTSITIAGAFNTTDAGIVGNWCLVTDVNNQTEQIARISAVSTNTLTFDWIRPNIGGNTAAFNPVPVAGSWFYVGLIECQLLKFFDFNAPQQDKRLMEIWLTQQGVDPNSAGTLIRYFRERESSYTQFATMQAMYVDTTGSDTWFAEASVPSELTKSFGLQFINRGYAQWRFLNLVIIPQTTP